MLPVILVKNGTFAGFQLVCDRRTDGHMDGRTDTPCYRDARTQLKTDLWQKSSYERYKLLVPLDQ